MNRIPFGKKFRFMLKKTVRFYLLLIISLISSVIIRIYIFSMYKIPTHSMSPTLEPGDYILVNKIIYGSRVMDWWKLLFEKKLEYHWHKGCGTIKKGDVYVFNLPQYWKLSDKYPDMYGAAIVKRCYGLPRDAVRIKKEMQKVENLIYWGGIETKPNLYPHDSTLNWTINNYGPLWVPGKQKSIKLSTENVKHYQDVLFYEGYKTETRNDSVFLNGRYAENYTFKYNYYFMLGDNFYNSRDSRYWGFVPQTHVIGKVVLVLFSIDPDEPWYKCFRWGRFFKRIK